MHISPALRRHQMLKASIFIATLAVTSGFSAAVLADPLPVYRSAAVKLADLDLSTPEGVTMARERIHMTARRLCSRFSVAWDRSAQHNYFACINDAVAEATPKLLELARLKSSTNLASNRTK